MEQKLFKLKQKESKDNNHHASNNNNGFRDSHVFGLQDVAFTATYHKLANEIWVFDSDACGHYCNLNNYQKWQPYDGNKSWKSNT
jgi:hypothetical protein